MNKRIVAIIIASAVLIIGIVFNAVGAFFSEDLEAASNPFSMTGEGPQEKVVEQGSLLNRIALVNIEGAIMSGGEGSGLLSSGGYNHEMIMNSLENIEEDDSIKGVLLYVNSPGGGVYESAQIHDQLLEIKEAGKTIYVSMGGMAASGGYYVSTPADQIFASNQTLTGSLGVIIQSINYHELADKYGIKFNTFTSGEFKDILSSSRPMTEEERNIIQGLVNESYEQFVDVIVSGRDMTEDRVKELADGRIYSGSQALENGLIDQIGFKEDALAALKKELGGNPQVIEYETGLGSIFGLPFAKALLPDHDLRFLQNLLDNRQGPTMMYMYSE